MNIVDISNEIHQELGSPTDIVIPVIANWLRNNIGQLNVALNTSFYLDENLEIVYLDHDVETAIDNEAKDIYKKMYQAYYYDMQIRKNILSYVNTPVIEVSSDGNTVRRASVSELGKNLYSFKKQVTDELVSLINGYKIRKSSPRQVAGDDTVAGYSVFQENLIRI